MMRALALALGVMALPQPANALCALLCSCDVSADDISFGTNIDPLSSGVIDATGLVHIHCTGVLNLFVTNDISLSSGGGSFAQRTMSDGFGHTLDYNLYQDSGHNTIWGTGGSYPDLDFDFLLGVLGYTYHPPIYARMPSQPTARPGSYSDTITLSLVF